MRGMSKHMTPPRDPKADALAREAFAAGRVRSTNEIVNELRRKTPPADGTRKQ